MSRSLHARRGRPKIIREEQDLGTPELREKRARGETQEALDLCLAKGLITEQQHWCGIHLRWLYTLRYGAPGVRALDVNHVSGMELQEDDPLWRAAREAEFHEAVQCLQQQGCANLLMDICVHHSRPLFLSGSCRGSISAAKSLMQFRDGLELLTKHWKRKPQPPQDR